MIDPKGKTDDVTGQTLMCFLVLLNVLILRAGYTMHPGLYWVFIISIPLLAISILRYRMYRS
jgi:hypothetical protein